MIKHLKLSNPTEADREALRKHFIATITDTVQQEKIQDKHEVIQSGVEEQLLNLERYFASEGVEENYLIATLLSKVIGTIAYGQASTLLFDVLGEDLRGVPEIKGVYILPAFQKRGVGSFLFTETRALLKASQISHYCLDCGYTRSQNYWRKKLGEPQYLLKDYWSVGNDHLIWKLPV